MSLTCEQARVMASDLLDESLKKDERAALLSHIETCTSCPHLYRSMAAVYQNTCAPQRQRPLQRNSVAR